MLSAARERMIVYILPVLFILLLAGLAAAPFAGMTGSPAFHQDWQWPVDASQCSGLSRFGAQPWDSAGPGSAQAYPEPWWPYLSESVSCTALGTHWSLVATVFVLIALCGLFAGLLAKRIFNNPYATIASIALYAGSPVVLNKLQAGHLLFLASYALMPAVAYLAMYAEGRLSWFVAGTLIGIGSAQQQFFFFDVFIYAALMRRKPAAAVVNVALTILTAGLFTCSEWIIAVAYAAAGSLNTLMPLPHYEASQSAYPLDALRAIGYIGGYDKRLLDGALPVLWFVPVCAAVGFILNARKDFAYRFAGIAIVGFLFVSGVFGPAGFIWQAAFAHIGAAAVFRELYNGAALLAFGACVLCAGAATALSRRVPAAAACVTAVSAAIGIFVCYRAAQGIPQYVVDPPTRSMLRQIASARGDFRFITVPSVYPLAENRGHSTGISPLTLPLGAHENANAFTAGFPATYVGLRAESAFPPQEQAASLALGAVIRIRGVRSAFADSMEPALKNVHLSVPTTTAVTALTNPSAQRLRVAPIGASAGTFATLRSMPEILSVVQDGKPVNLITLQNDVDPRRSWVRTAFWPALGKWIYAEPPGVFTLTKSRALNLPGAVIIAGAQDSPPRARGCVRVKNLDTHFALYHCSADPVFSGQPPLAISGAWIGGRLAKDWQRQGRVGTVRTTFSRQWALTADVSADAGSAIVLAESFDPHWTIDVAGARHVRADGFANAWILPAAFHGTVRVRYTPARVFFVFLFISYACVPAALLLALSGGCRFRTVQDAACGSHD